MDNMNIYNQVKQVPKIALREIQAGRLKGKSDINPMWRIETLTSLFGPCGFGWKFSIIKQWLEEGGNGEKSAFCNIELFIKYEGVWSEAIPGTGGASFIANEKNGPYTSDECFKMALTDAISVACKALGVGADTYWQKPDSKYEKPTQQVKSTPSEKQPEENKPNNSQLLSINALAQKKNVNLKEKGPQWTGKNSGSLWTIQDFMKVKTELEKLEDAV